MPDRIPLPEAGLRDALRDPRYWKPGPEREAYAAWVTDGFKAMYNSGEAKGGTVHVRAYDRKRDGKVEHVGAHTRSPPPGGLATPAFAPAAIAAAPAVIRTLPFIAGAIAAMPKPGMPDLSSLIPEWKRSSLLHPPERGGRRHGTINGARPFEVPEEEAGESAPNTLESRRPDNGDELDEYTRRRPPPGSVPIDETDWSLDHGGIKKQFGGRPKDDVRISPDGDAWIRNPDGTWTNEGAAGNMIGGNRPSGRQGQGKEPAAMNTDETSDRVSYRYNLGIQIFHPTLQASEVTDALGLEPDYFWDAGAERFTASGKKLPGVRETSYWAFSDDIDDERAFLSTGVKRLLSLLEECREDILRIVDTGGECTVVIGLPGRINIGDEIGWQEMQRLADLHVGLGIEVFPGMGLPGKGVAPQD